MRIDRKWLGEEVANFKAERPIYEEYAVHLEAQLDAAVRPLCGSAIVQARAKELPSFARKCVKYAKEEKEPSRRLTDLCGARVIVQTLEQVQAVSAFVRANFTIDEANSQDTFKRLGAEEFGYRSVHYIVIVTVDPDDPPSWLNWAGVSELDGVLRIRSEIQIRTFAQHVWADFAHDTFYKSSFQSPKVWRRESARVAAQLETVDDTFAHIQGGMRRLETNLGTYHDEQTTVDDIDSSLAVLEHDPKNTALLNRIVRLQMSIGLYDDAIERMEEFPGTPDEDFTSNHGYALCRHPDHQPTSAEYKRGMALLEEVAAVERPHVEALTRRAELTSRDQPEVLRKRWQAAFEADPSDPRALTGYLRNELADFKNLSLLPLLRPVIKKAIRRAEDQVTVRVNLPRALFYIAELQLLLEKPLDALCTLCRALGLTANPVLIDDLVHATGLLATVKKQLPGFTWFERVLQLYQSTQEGKLHPEIGKLVHTPDGEGGSRVNLDPDRQVVIVAGGCDPAAFHNCEELRPVLEDGFRSFTGTIISGGTEQGICGLIADIAFDGDNDIELVGYLPRYLPTNGTATKDQRYRNRCADEGVGFSPMEVIRSWVDILASGIDPADVRMIGVNGGDIARFEYRLAAALGAQVGVFRESGREADRLLVEQHEPGNDRIIFLPADRQTLVAFLGSRADAPWSDDEEALACLTGRIREAYELARLKQARDERDKLAEEDPELAAKFDRSNREQALHILEKLYQIGLTAVPVSDPRPAALTEFDQSEQHREWVEQLAEMEHGRFNVERLFDGWTLGPRDDEKRQRPSLVPWRELEKDDLEKDREAVRAIPELLAEIGFKIVAR